VSKSKLRRDSGIRFQEAAESLFAFDLRRLIFDKGEDVFFGLPVGRFVVETLVGSFVVVMVEELFQQKSQVFLAQDEEMVETFMAKSLGESLSVGVQIWGERTDSFHFGSLGRPDRIELLVYLESWSMSRTSGVGKP
jgi:hypothetical protein